MKELSRREMIAGCGIGLAGASMTTIVAAATADKMAGPDKRGAWRYCLNTATIRGQKLPLDQEVETAAQCGYQGIEPWVENIARYAEAGKSLEDLSKRIADSGLTVESAIGFPNWIVDDDAQRAKGLEQMKRDMDLVSRIGGRRIAAPPAGAHGTTGMDLRKIGERYRTVLELGRQMGVVPQLEIWGGSKTLSRLSEAAYVALESAHPDACLLLDVFHIYKSGTGFTGLRLLNGAAMHVLHLNDYPAQPPRETITDGQRVYPGDGVAPMSAILRDFWASGFRGTLSLELFNGELWKQEPLAVARKGLEKMRAAVEKALGEGATD